MVDKKWTPYHKWLVSVNSCPVPRLPNHRCGQICHNSPAGKELIVRVNLQVKRLVDALAEKTKFWQLLAILRDPAYNHQLLIIILAELRARELHLKREFWIVLRKLGCQRYWIEWVWHILEAN